MFFYNTKEIGPAYVSKHNLKCKNQVILLMITDVKKEHYLAVKRLSALLKAITSNHNRDFYCLNLEQKNLEQNLEHLENHSFRTKSKLKKHINVCKNHNYCYVEMPKEDNKILKYNHRENSMRTPFIIYADLESLPEKMSACHNDSETSSTTKTNKHTAFGYSLFTHNKFDYYRGKNCMKNFCLDLRKHTKK